MSVCHICSAHPCLRESLYTSGLVSVSPSQCHHCRWWVDAEHAAQDEWTLLHRMLKGCYPSWQHSLTQNSRSSSGYTGKHPTSIQANPVSVLLCRLATWILSTSTSFPLHHTLLTVHPQLQLGQQACSDVGDRVVWL